MGELLNFSKFFLVIVTILSTLVGSRCGLFSSPSERFWGLYRDAENSYKNIQNALLKSQNTWSSYDLKVAFNFSNSLFDFKIKLLEWLDFVVEDANQKFFELFSNMLIETQLLKKLDTLRQKQFSEEKLPIGNCQVLKISYPLVKEFMSKYMTDFFNNKKEEANLWKIFILKSFDEMHHSHIKDVRFIKFLDYERTCFDIFIKKFFYLLSFYQFYFSEVLLCGNP